ncbi:hypothetical protein D3OALGA1CA_3972 [Olavius algarvensis associated proteobacterium Delta 3]|nr:hypothetical protein D3OALGB2SA_1776 [Olavius algarvensis associated proteobacterium Delta 3]CAB5143015.1 hypothetical protein D3OALGA1CA_3972 [Olavius algarvensis associated proteobacterium Delta 3]
MAIAKLPYGLPVAVFSAHLFLKQGHCGCHVLFCDFSTNTVGNGLIDPDVHKFQHSIAFSCLLCCCVE